ncbi:hypothetical protein FCV60_12330 [Vibrio sp. F13]|nr:hypothetical protein FCV49_19540 [Vibrio sp. F13]TKF45189.1 hypothetical protein FCV57_03440 [Vibrio sp. F13]TKF53459.1 hypothetical protein FCV60_12330 [Vibrio sp. F13]TKF65530.1 hypothetical protein FCV58_12465 [Vibrio sp. F13]TKG01500.1 hypothetical protein FCV76_11820 [Vibrio sp. F13]
MKHVLNVCKSMNFAPPISVRWPTFGSLTLQLRLPKSVSDLFSIQLKAQPQNTTSPSVISSGDS